MDSIQITVSKERVLWLLWNTAVYTVPLHSTSIFLQKLCTHYGPLNHFKAALHHFSADVFLAVVCHLKTSSAFLILQWATVTPFSFILPGNIYFICFILSAIHYFFEYPKQKFSRVNTGLFLTPITALVRHQTGLLWYFVCLQNTDLSFHP